jgi:Protein of unknown function (DUF1579)
MRSMLSLAVVALFISTAAMADDAPKLSADQQAMMEKASKAAKLGPQHEALKKWAGDWDCTVKYMMDSSQPWQEAKTTANTTTLMDGRYVQETSTGEMMGSPFTGIALYGYDNVIRKYVSTWIDNFGTGIMKSEGSAAASGNAITWVGTMSDPMTGKPAKERMVSTMVDDDHRTLEMYGVPPGAKKEMKMMTIEYSRKK